jgi:hypothetical protein
MKKGEKETSGGKVAMEKTTQFHRKHKQQEVCMHATVSALDIFYLAERGRGHSKRNCQNAPYFINNKMIFPLGE